MGLEGRQVLVTGASGFVGGALSRMLAAQGALVRGLVRKPSRAGYIDGQPGIEIVTGDLGDADSLRRASTGCDVVFHVAAATGGSLDKQSRVNVDGTRTAAQTAAESGVRRFVYVSSIGMYGFKDLPDRVTEDLPLNEAAYAYAVTKRQGEAALREVATQTGLGYSIIRPAFIYGPRSNPWTVQMFKLARLPVIPFIGDGSGHAHPIYIDDVCAMMMTLAEHPAAEGEAFNCAPDPGVPWREFLGAYSRLKGSDRWLGIPPVLVKPIVSLIAALAPGDSLLKDLPDALRTYLRPVTFTTEKARTRLGWQPRVSFEQGIQHCAVYLREIGLL